MQKKRESENKKQESKSWAIKLFIRQMLFAAVFLLIVFALGIFTAQNTRQLLVEQEIELPAYGFEDFLLYFALATLFILLIVYLPKVKKARPFIFKFIFIFTGLYGGLIVLSLFLPDIFALALLLLLFLWWMKSASVISHNILIVLAMAGIGAMFGLSIEPKIIVLLLVILSFYDFIAVYKTKHMVKMAETMIEQGAIMGLIVPSRVSGFQYKAKEAHPGKFMIMGGGDIIFPLMLAVSVLETGLAAAIIVALFAFFGIIFTFTIFVLQKEKKPIPALPPIALFSILGYLITLF